MKSSLNEYCNKSVRKGAQLEPTDMLVVAKQGQQTQHIFYQAKNLAFSK